MAARLQKPRNFEGLLSHIPKTKITGPGGAREPCPVAGHTTPAGHLTLTDAGDKARKWDC